MINRRTLFMLLIGVLPILLPSQNDDSWKLFDDSHMARIDVTIDSTALKWIYSNVESDSEHVAGFRFRNNWIDETIDSIGFRLRGNTSRDAQKKSFKISFNTFKRGRDFHNVEKLNLNGEHNDPSIIRSKLCFDLYKEINVKASRANHVEVYINGSYYGLYINVEHIDEEFLKMNFADDSGNLWKCLYPADLVYHGNDPDVYKNLSGNGRPVYELTTNEDQMDFGKLARLINLINNTSSNNILDSIESVIDVPEVLKYFAINVLTGSWDDYWSLMNNYYLYHDPSADLFHLIPYDYDNSFGVDWFNINWTTVNPYNFPKVVSGARPLAEKILANSQYKNLYTHFIEFISDNVYKLNLWEGHIDSLKNIIAASAISDLYRSLDYGFTANDFFDSYLSTGYSNQHVKFGLKQFINLRNNSIPSQLSYTTNVKPIVYRINYEPKNPKPEDSIKVYVSAFSKIGLSEVLIRFTPLGSTVSQDYLMLFSPIADTKNVDEADRYVGVIPPLGEGNSGNFTVYVKDFQNQSITYPRKNPINIKAASSVVSDIVINEFLADNLNSLSDSSGQHDDWLELYNPISSPVLLTGRYLTDNPNNLTKWKFTNPAFYLNPGEYLIIWCDEDLTQAGLHTNFKLSKSGEYIALVETDGVSVLDSISFGAQNTDLSYGRSPDASTDWQFLNPTPGSSNVLTNISDKNTLLDDFRLKQNYPNPFNPTTKLGWHSPVSEHILLKVFDVLGNEVAMLVNEVKAAGTHQVEFDGSRLPSGLYFYQLKSGSNLQTKKMILLR